MSQENVGIVQRAYKVFDDAGFSGAAGLDLGAFDADIEVDTSKRPLDADVFRGHDGLREFLSLQRGMWKRRRLEPQEFISVDEKRVVVATRIVSVGRGEVKIISHAASVWTLRAGRITHVKLFQHKGEALDAVGLSERIREHADGPASEALRVHLGPHRPSLLANRLRDTGRAMSQENLEIVRRGYEMYASGDLEGLVTLIAPDAELADAGGLGITGTASGTRFGPSGFLRSSDEAHEAFEQYTVTPEDFTALRNFVLVRARLRGKGRASGVPLDAVVFQLWELSDGKVVRSQIFMTESQALEAVGPSE